MMVKPVVWNTEKNIHLFESRNISFEIIMVAIENGGLLDVMHHPNQKLWIVKVLDYAYVVPIIETDENIFLKTIFPSRKFTK